MTNRSGTGKWLNESENIGFIRSGNGGEDLFAHYQDTQPSGFQCLAESQRSSFDCATGPKGAKAVNIRAV